MIERSDHSKRVSRLLSRFPVVALLGPRQVGKSTLARDVKRLSHFYQLKASTPLDMFPQTAEIESVSVLELRK